MELQICRPEAEGLSSSAILAFVEAAETELEALHSLMILRHGHIVTQGWWQPYGASYNHRLFSLSKSFTSTAIGLAVSEGLLRVDDLVVSFFSDALPQEPSENLLAMRIRDLLAMTSGHHNDTLGRLLACEDGQWTRAFLALPVEHKPGTHFVYNTGATYMLAAILQQVTGETLQDYLQPRLFGPLGIQNPKWQMSPEGVHVGGWGLRVTTEDIARFGQLYLQKGQWEGKQLVPEEWVAQATLRQTSNGSNPESDWEQGYGYQFWRCRHNAYRGDGAFGQFCLVMPDQDMVVAITSGLKNMQSVLDLIWKYVLPAVQSEPLPPNDQDYNLLQEKMGSLSLPVVQGLATSSLATDVSG
ncbi:MAG: serine hydrolase domain-containing protein, partial [Candidatus Latescibacterota bacterium]